MKTMKQQLQQWMKVNGKPIPVVTPTKAEKLPQRGLETLTERDWKELMGKYRLDTFKCHRGSVRRK